jgi:hypothetical protein
MEQHEKTINDIEKILTKTNCSSSLKNYLIEEFKKIPLSENETYIKLKNPFRRFELTQLKPILLNNWDLIVDCKWSILERKLQCLI